MYSTLITGGAGFIGSNLSKRLLEEGHSVHAVDNLITGSEANVLPLLTNPAFSFTNIDITNPGFVDSFKTKKFDRVYHLACPTGVPNLIKLATEMLETCSIGTLNALEIARRSGAAFLLTSSAEVYGEPLLEPQTEEYSGNVHPLGARSAYEEGKRFAESCVIAHVRTYGLNARIVRVFNTFGPGMSLSDTRIIPSFVQALLTNSPLTIYGNGKQTRCHIYVDDLVSGLVIAMESGKSGEAYNVGSSRQLSVRELAELLGKLSNRDMTTHFEPHFIEDHKSRLPDTQKIQALGWKQHVSLEDGLTKMLEYYGVLPTVHAWQNTPSLTKSE